MSSLPRALPTRHNTVSNSAPLRMTLDRRPLGDTFIGPDGCGAGHEAEEPFVLDYTIRPNGPERAQQLRALRVYAMLETP